MCLVGGAVRDALLGLESLDLDMVVEEEGGAQKLAEALSTFWGEASTSAHALGQGYPIWQLVFTSNDGLGYEIQIAETQKEMFMQEGSRQRIAHFGSLEEDCLRRDFTYNMLYYDLTAQNLIDPSGVGLADLENNFLRTHPEVSSQKIFHDDPLRMIRLLRFVSRFQSNVDQETEEALKKCFSRIEILSAERIRDEWLKLCKQGGFSFFWKTIQEWGLLSQLCPEFLPMIECGQDGRFHSEGDVWQHTLLVMKNSENTALQQFTALLHDIAKPITRSEEGDRVKFLGHEKVGAKMSREFLNKWKLPKKLRKDIERLVYLHLRGSDVSEWKSLKPARKLLRECDGLDGELLKFIRADSMSSVRENGEIDLSHLAPLEAALLEAKKEKELLPIPSVSGRIIMERFPGAQGEEIGALKKQAEELAEQWRDAGREFTDKEILDELAKKSKFLN